MALPIISADQRLMQTGLKIQIWGGYKIGKTSQILTISQDGTLVIDFEAGLLAVGASKVKSTDRVRTWDDARHWACYVCGPDPAAEAGKVYSKQHYDWLCNTWGDPAQLNQYENIFVDSTSNAGSLCLRYCQQQPQAQSKGGGPDIRAAYGMLATEMVAWCNHWQHSPKNVILVGGLEQREDETRRKVWVPLIDGAKSASALPYIFDEIITMADVSMNGSEPFRAFVCQKINPWGFPAGDRSGRLKMLEEPHLGRLMEKIRSQPPRAADQYAYDLPPNHPPAPEQAQQPAGNSFSL